MLQAIPSFKKTLSLDSDVADTKQKTSLSLVFCKCRRLQTLYSGVYPGDLFLNRSNFHELRKSDGLKLPLASMPAKS